MMTMAMNLDQMHPDYLETQASRVKSRDLYDGTAAVQEKGETYLFREANESDEDYELRLKRAVVDNYVELIVMARQSILFRKVPAREIPEKLRPFESNVDRRGTPAQVFFAEVAKQAQIDGIAWVAVDMPQAPLSPTGEVAFRSRKDEVSADHRPFMELIPGANVLDWSVDQQGRLEWLVVKQTSIAERVPGDVAETVNQWKIWTPTTWTLYQESTAEQKKAADDTGYSLVSQGTHQLGRIPVIPFLGIRHTDYSGWPVAESILDHIILIYNKASDLDWFERLVSHPIPYLIGPNKLERMNSGAGIWIDPGTESSKVELGFLEVTGASFDGLRTSIANLEAKILLISLAQSQRAGAQVQSQDSQREYRKIFASSLNTASIGYESGEKQAWDLMARWLGDTSDAADIQYSRDFDDQNIETAMVSALSDLVMNDILSMETFLEVLKRGECLPTDLDVEQELARIRERDSRRTQETVLAINRATDGQQEAETPGGQTG